MCPNLPHNWHCGRLFVWDRLFLNRLGRYPWGCCCHDWKSVRSWGWHNDWGGFPWEGLLDCDLRGLLWVAILAMRRSSSAAVVWRCNLCSWVRRMLCTAWNWRSSSIAVREATMGMYSIPSPLSNWRIWSFYGTSSPIATRLSKMCLSFWMYSIMMRGPFLVVWKASFSCIVLALVEAKKLHSRVVHAS